MSVFSRLLSFSKRVRLLSPYAGGHLPAVLAILRFKANPVNAQQLKYNGINFYCRLTDIGAIKEVLANQEYAPLKSLLDSKANINVVDAGGHIGTFAMWLLGVFPNAKITSIEADPDTYDLASKNCHIWQPNGFKWTVIHRAASGTEGENVTFNRSGPSMGHRLSADGDTTVLTTDLAHLVDRQSDEGGTIDLLKVDIEGAEEDFLCAKPELLERVRVLVVELHPKSCNTARVLETLRTSFKTVEEIPGRFSSKPLLLCYR